jgi:predicted GNAT family acetyltransferase
MNEILDNKDLKRFELEVESKIAFLNYEVTMGHFCINHTEVPTELGGQGIGSKLIRHAMEYAKVQNLKVFPFCPFAARYIKKNDALMEQVGKGFKWDKVV